MMLGTACTSNRAAVTAAGPETLSAYLASSNPADILVTDKSGGSHWYHNPTMDGDSLRGVRGHDLPRYPVAIAVADIAGIQEAHFSAGRTLGLIGGVLAVVTAAVLILGSQVSYSY